MHRDVCTARVQHVVPIPVYCLLTFLALLPPPSHTQYKATTGDDPPATVSPAVGNLPETVATLRYAARMRRIVNRPVVNEDPSTALISALQQEPGAGPPTPQARLH